MNSRWMATASVLLMIATAFTGMLPVKSWMETNGGQEIARAPATLAQVVGVRGTGYLNDGNLTGAMSNASDGDVIYVSEGVHTISVEDGFNKSVTLIGNGTGATLDHGANKLYLGVHCNFTNINFSSTTETALSMNETFGANFTDCELYSSGGAAFNSDGGWINATNTSFQSGTSYGINAAGLLMAEIVNCTIIGFENKVAMNAEAVFMNISESSMFGGLTGDSLVGNVSNCSFIGETGLSFGSLTSNISFSTFNITVNSCISSYWFNGSIVNTTLNGTSAILSDDESGLCTLNITNSSITGNVTTKGIIYLHGLNVSLIGSGAGIIYYYMPAHVIVDNTSNQAVMIQTAPGVNATNGTGTTDAYGRANFSNVFQGYANATGYYNQTYLYRTAIPDGWSFANINVTSADKATQPEYLLDMGDGTIMWFGQFNNWVVSNLAKDLDFRSANATSYVSPAENITTNYVNSANLNVSLEFHNFNFTISNFTNSAYGDIPAMNYSLDVYKFGEYVTSISTTNGSACWSGRLPFGYTYETQLRLPVPAYAIAGNYTARYNLTATNGPTATDTGTYVLRVLGTPAINGTPTLGQSTVLYPSGLLAGSVSDIDSLNNYQINNTGTAQLDQVQFLFEDMICGTDRLNVSESLSIYNALSSQTVTTSGGYANLSFSAWLASPVPSRTFQFSISEIPDSTPNGTYVGNFTVRAKSGSTWSNTLTGNHTIRVNGTYVQVTLGYTKSPSADPTGAQSNVSSVTYGTMSPSATDVTPKAWFFIANHGNVAITRLEMLVSDLNNASQSAKIDMDSNGYVIDYDTEVHYDIGASNDITINTNIAPGESQYFLLCIDAIPAAAMSCTYTGYFTVTAIHTPGSRSVGEGELWDLVGSYIGTEGNTTDLAILMTDYSTIVNFTSPLEEDQEAANQLIVRNNGFLPYDSFVLLLNSTVPASYYVEDAYGNTFTFDPISGECAVDLPAALGIGQWAALRFYVGNIDASYDTTANYTEAQTVSVSGVRSFGLTYPETVFGGNLTVTINGVVGSKTTTAGRNYITVPSVDGNIHSALDLKNLTGVVWVAAWDTATNSWEYCFGSTTNFALSAGQGVIVYTSIAVSIEFAGTIPTLVNVSIESGLTLTGNPTGTGIYASDLNSSSGVVWISIGDDGEYDYYFPDNPTGSTNFYIAPYAAFWARATEASTIIEEE